MDRTRQDGGMVLVVTLLLMLLLSALAAGFALVTSSEMIIAANFRDAQETMYAADAAAERAVADLGAAADWTSILTGAVSGTLVDGPPSGPRTLADGAVLDLGQVVSLASCQQSNPCSSAQMDAVTVDRPWGPNNPRWQLFSYGPLRDVQPSRAPDTSCYIVVLVGDDSSETDGDPLRDADSPGPGAGVIVIRVYAFGPRGARRTMQATVARTSPGHARVLAWHEVT